MSDFKRPGWRKRGAAYETGAVSRGACVWPWLGDDWYRLQVWDRPRTRLITYRSRRTLQQAMARAEAWLSERPAPEARR